MNQKNISNAQCEIIPLLKIDRIYVFVNKLDLDENNSLINKEFVKCVVVHFDSGRISEPMNIYQWIKHVEIPEIIPENLREEIVKNMSYSIFSKSEIKEKIYNPLEKDNSDQN